MPKKKRSSSRKKSLLDCFEWKLVGDRPVCHLRKGAKMPRLELYEQYKKIFGNRKLARKRR